MPKTRLREMRRIRERRWRPKMRLPSDTLREKLLRVLLDQRVEASLSAKDIDERWLASAAGRAWVHKRKGMSAELCGRRVRGRTS